MLSVLVLNLIFRKCKFHFLQPFLKLSTCPSHHRIWICQRTWLGYRETEYLIGSDLSLSVIFFTYNKNVRDRWSQKLFSICVTSSRLLAPQHWWYLHSCSPKQQLHIVTATNKLKVVRSLHGCHLYYHERNCISAIPPANALPVSLNRIGSHIHPEDKTGKSVSVTFSYQEENKYAKKDWLEMISE